ncbi:hypothetical protein CEUSTIGMA_g3359.t1 [Chlamydomonas eustigma]|uniref:Uncharacterized protein n=1 Tax=Chlamydomonas eustigma TaxID=1157962 RepID=A0A250WYQ6_9CHLO|nr:hypothetical protein CEUSTIGMA_g3359.t1 [Chlamydomonas eustigma]|eukprot:GAX75916.1 hypothetical protein CEUSTIGMA_g3359.t1 [Chlamydomonas eustigma]
MGLFSCASGASDVPSKKALLISLEKARSELQRELKHAHQKISSLERDAEKQNVQLEVLSKKGQSCDEDLQEKLLNDQKILERCNMLVKAFSAVETNIEGQSSYPKELSVEVTAYDPEDSHHEYHAREGELGGRVSEGNLELGTEADFSYISPSNLRKKPDLSNQGLQTALDKLEHGSEVLLQRLHEASELFHTLQQANAEAEQQLKAVEAQKDALDEMSRQQLQVADLRNSALEQENTALAGITAELEGQVVRLKQEVQDLNESSDTALSSIQAELLTMKARESSLSNSLAEAQDNLEQTRVCLSDKDAKLADLRSLLLASAQELEASRSALSGRETVLQSESAKRAEEEASRKEAQRDVMNIKKQLAEALGRVAAEEAENEGLRLQLESLREELSHVSEAAAVGAEAQQALLVAKRQLVDMDTQVVPALQERQRLSEVRVAALAVELDEARSMLCTAQQQTNQRTSDLAAANARLEEHQRKAKEMEAVLSATRASAEAERLAASDMTAQYLTAKRDLISTAKQLAGMAGEHGKTLEKLRLCDEQLATVQQELSKVQAQLQDILQDKASSSRRLRELESEFPAVSEELAVVRKAHAEVCMEVEAKRALLAAIARMSVKGGSKDKQAAANLDDVALLGYYQAALSEDRLCLKVCEAPLPLCGSLLAAVADSRQLKHLALDLDSSREMVWEKVGLRMACLAAALGLNTSIRTLELSGWTWSELGNGSALPFLTLGSAGSNSALSCVKVDTKLFDVDCASSLVELLLRGVVQPKRPGGQGVLRLYSDNDALDEWYGHMIQDAVDFRADALSIQADHDRSAGIQVPYGADAGTPLPVLLPSSAHKTPARGKVSPLHGASFIQTAHSPAGSASSFNSMSMMNTPTVRSKSAGFPLLPASATPVDADLSSEALESHHMVVVMVVFITCPHLHTLRLDSNKIGDAGAELLSLGLQKNSTLQELGLARNNVLASGAKKLVKALEAHPALIRLDLSGQRFEGLGPGGCDAVANLIRANTVIQEIDVSGNSIGATGAAALSSALRGAPLGCRLIRLAAGANGLDSASCKALQAAGSERGVVIAA